MKSRVLALVCVLAVLVSLLAASGLTVNASDDTFRVGYARVNITPYVVDGDISSGILTLPLRGSGDVWNRPSMNLVDDNGDGEITEEDGLFATCIAITDSHDKTVLLVTIDVIGVSNYSDYRTEICSRLAGQVAENEIMLSGTHTHGAPDITVYNDATRPTGTNTVDGFTYSYDDMNTNLGTWINRTLEDIGDMAVAAMNDRSPATMSKGQLSAAVSEAANGRVMNSVRHYVNSEAGCVAGDNFNSRGSDPTQVSEVNDNMYMLQFDFAESTGKESIVLANWRGHPSLNSSSSEGDKYAITSDYVNAFRTRVEQEGYRAAFFQGAGGNVNPRGYELQSTGEYAYSWIDAFNVNDGDIERGNGYGKALGEMALECLDTANGHMAAVAAGAIRTCQKILYADRNNAHLSDLAYDAAAAASEEYSAGASGKYVYTDAATGEKYVIASKYHASSILGKWDRENSVPAHTSQVQMEINTILLGDGVAFVTAPGEPFDRYSLEATLETANNYNDWDNLLGESLGADFGTPFVLGYCNGTVGYIPNYIAYDYNDNDACYGVYAIGSYEAQTTRLAQGTGEKMIAAFADMLTHSANDETYRTAYCEHCQKTVSWTPISAEYNLKANLTGHCYLAEDLDAPQLLVKDSQMLCLDLNGYSITGATRCLYVYSGGVANVFDTSEAQTGTMYGRGSEDAVTSGFGGSTFMVERTAVFNLYGGTLTRISGDTVTAKNGGVGFIRGEFNMYGGTITGGVAENIGGNLYILQDSAVFRMYGGTITNGTAKGSALSNCVHTSAPVFLSGDGCIDEIRFVPSSADGAPTLEDWLTIQGEFTGKVSLRFDSSVSVGTDVGTSDGALLSGSDITVVDSDLFVWAEGTDLVMAEKRAMLVQDGQTTLYNTLHNAITASYASPGSYVALCADIPAGEIVEVTEDAYLDLNGFDVAGSISVASGKTLYCMDAQTDDYTVSDDSGYGKLTGSVSGTVEGVPAGTVSAPESEQNQHRAGYLKITEADGVSFHRVNLQLTAMSLRADSVGVYYKSNFAGDEVVAQNVVSFGVALSVVCPPDSAAMYQYCAYSAFTDFQSGAGSNSGSATGTLLRDIMKVSNTDETNDRNANMQVYGRAYIETADGLVFGDYVARSLVDQLTAIEGMWAALSEKQQLSVMKMYAKYETVMDSWGLTSIQQSYAAYKESAA